MTEPSIDRGSEAHRMIPEGGLALAEAYKSYVENDDEWEMRNAECDLWEPGWAQLLRDEWPGCTMVKVPRRATGVAQLPSALCVPAEIERRSTVREECWRCARMAWGWGEDPGEKPDDVPDKAVQVHARRRECEARLIGHLRAGNLIAKGVRECPEPRADLEPESIGPGWWSRKDLLVGFAANALFRSLDDRREPVLFFSNVRVYRADALIKAPAARVTPQPQPPGTVAMVYIERGGRKPGETGKLYNLISEALQSIENPMEHFNKRGVQIPWAEEFHKSHKGYKLGSIQRELRSVLKDLRKPSNPESGSKADS